MFDPKQLLDQLLGSQVPGTTGTVREKANDAVNLAKANPLATGAIAAALLGTGMGRKLTGSALKLGGLAAIAGLGYHAYQNYQKGRQPQEGQLPSEPELLPPPDSEFGSASSAQADDFALVLVRAMIAAARADGHIDERERQQILGKVQTSGLDADAAAFLDAELSNPVDLDSIIAAAKTEAQKVELYTASRLAIDPDTRAERGYLDLLAGRLGLADPLIDHIDATVSAAKV
ncbi:tellurite resistance TerB family protein [Rhizobium sp. L1K21]|uniref:tellurite resistance TerB family protein n=1 Tax=Rhizobium sp. L1K21 TaxID=2954933 RepID=UPI002092BAA0|nr:tellurite resistance TerB family protein [Rhizobium sp. L1K21]MCO6184960.1 tellurite resistance TerB family protein [Rhizobium sp. L1K21]